MTIRGAGLDVYAAYSGKESLDVPVFRDPDVLKRQISAIAPFCRGFLLAWRRTSAHLLLQDEAFTTYLMRCAREANPRIAIIGEGYYGMTTETGARPDRLTYTMPENASACALVGVGTDNINVEVVVKRLFAKVNGIPKLAVVLGPRPYYGTQGTGRLSRKDIAESKIRLERRFVKAGCAGTITLHGDGSDGLYGQFYTDNLSTTNHP
jgi:hypothetical protein